MPLCTPNQHQCSLNTLIKLIVIFIMVILMLKFFVKQPLWWIIFFEVAMTSWDMSHVTWPNTVISNSTCTNTEHEIHFWNQFICSSFYLIQITVPFYLQIIFAAGKQISLVNWFFLCTKRIKLNYCRLSTNRYKYRFLCGLMVKCVAVDTKFASLQKGCSISEENNGIIVKIMLRVVCHSHIHTR